MSHCIIYTITKSSGFHPCSVYKVANLNFKTLLCKNTKYIKICPMFTKYRK